MAENVRILVNGEQFSVTVLERSRDSVLFEIDGRSYQVEIAAAAQLATAGEGIRPQRPSAMPRSTDGGRMIVAPIPGVVVELLVSVGDKVKVGDVVARLEAMKMQNNIVAASDGTVAAILVNPGDEVTDSQPLIELAA